MIAEYIFRAMKAKLMSGHKDNKNQDKPNKTVTSEAPVGIEQQQAAEMPEQAEAQHGTTPKAPKK